MSKIDAGLVVPIPILPVACWRTNCEVPNVSPPAKVLVLVLVTARLVMVVVPKEADVADRSPICADEEKRLVLLAVVEKKLVDVAFVVVPLVATRVVAEIFVIVASVDVNVSITPVVKRATVEKREVDVAA